MAITKEQLMIMSASSENATKYVPYLNEVCIKFDINTQARMAMFISQLDEESGNLSKTRENLNYSVEALLKQWPTHFTVEQSNRLGRKKGEGPISLERQLAIADLAYGGRMGNSIYNKHDGSAFLGRGLIQLTGRNNYSKCSTSLNVDFINKPELLETPYYAVMSAGWYWHQAGCNKASDSYDEQALLKVTKLINGGYGNIEARRAKFAQAKKIQWDLTPEVAQVKPVLKLVVKVAPVTNILVQKPVETEVKVSWIALFLKIFKGK